MATAGIVAGMGQFAEQERRRAIDQDEQQRSGIRKNLQWAVDNLSRTPIAPQAMQLLGQLDSMKAGKLASQDNNFQKAYAAWLHQLTETRNQEADNKTNATNQQANEYLGNKRQITAPAIPTPPPINQEVVPAMHPDMRLPGITRPLEPVQTPPPLVGQPPQPQSIEPVATPLPQQQQPVAGVGSTTAPMNPFQAQAAAVADEQAALFERELRIKAQVGEEKAQRFLKQIEGKTPEAKYYIALAHGFSPSSYAIGGGGGVTRAAGVVDGKKIKGRFPLDDYGNETESGQKYLQQVDRSGNVIGILPVDNPFGTRSYDQWFIDHEMSAQAGQNVYSVGRFDRQGSLIRVDRGQIPPPSYLPTIRNTYQVVTDRYGAQRLLPVTETTTRGIPPTASPVQGAPGAVATELPPEAGQQPTPRPAVGSGVRPSVGRPSAPVGEKPWTLEEQKYVSSALNAARHLRSMEAMVANDPALLVRDIVGLSRRYDALRTEAMDMIARPRTGAAIPEPERQMYMKQFPGWRDLAAEWLGEPGVISAKFKMYIGLMDYLSKWKESMGQAEFPEQLSLRRFGSGEGGAGGEDLSGLSDEELDKLISGGDR